jgi:four helix bundle protein
MDLEKRTLDFALRIMRFISTFPRNVIADVLGRQLMKAGTSSGADYREANSAESKSDFIHKIAISAKEAAETVYWRKLCLQAPVGNPAESEQLMKEARDLLAIFTACGKTAKANRAQ